VSRGQSWFELQDAQEAIRVDPSFIKSAMQENRLDIMILVQTYTFEVRELNRKMPESISSGDSSRRVVILLVVPGSVHAGQCQVSRVPSRDRQTRQESRSIHSWSAVIEEQLANVLLSFNFLLLPTSRFTIIIILMLLWHNCCEEKTATRHGRCDLRRWQAKLKGEKK